MEKRSFIRAFFKNPAGGPCMLCLQETKFKKTSEEAGLFRRVGLLGWWVY